MTTSVSIADVFVEVTSRVDDLFATFDKIEAKIKGLEDREVAIPVTFEAGAEEKIDRIAAGVTTIAKAIETLGTLGKAALAGFGGTIDDVTTKVSKSSKVINTEVEQSVGQAERRMSRLKAVLNAVFDPRAIGTIFSMASGIALLAENGFNLNQVMETFGSTGSNSFAIVRQEASLLSRTLSLANTANFLKSILGLLGGLAPQVFGMAGAVALLVSSTARFLKLVESVLNRRPISVVAQFTNLLGSLNRGLFGLEFRMQSAIAKSRIFVGAILAGAAAFSKVSLGLTGILSLGPLAVTSILGLGGVFQLLGVQAQRLTLKLRASLGSGQAQFQQFLFGLRQLGPILTGLGKVAAPLGRFLERASKFRMASLKNQVVGFVRDLLALLASVQESLQKIATILQERLPTALRVLDRMTDSMKKLDKATRRGGRGPPGAGGDGGFFSRIFGSSPQEAKRSLEKNTSTLFSSTIASLNRGGSRVDGALQIITNRTKDRLKSFATGALALLTPGIGPALQSVLVPTLISPLLWKPIAATALGAIIRESKPFFQALKKEFVQGFTESAKPVRSAAAEMFTGLKDGVRAGLEALKKAFATESKSVNLVGFLGAFLTNLMGGSADSLAAITQALEVGGGRIGRIFTSTLGISLRTALGGSQVLGAVLTRMFGLKGISAGLIQKAADNFNKAGVVPVFKRAFRLAGAVIPALIGDTFRFLGSQGAVLLRILSGDRIGGGLQRRFLGNGSFTGRALQQANETGDPIRTGFSNEQERLAAAVDEAESNLDKTSTEIDNVRKAMGQLAQASQNLAELIHQQVRSDAARGIFEKVRTQLAALTGGPETVKARRDEVTATQQRIQALLQTVRDLEGERSPAANKRRKAALEQLAKEGETLANQDALLGVATKNASLRMRRLDATLEQLATEVPELRSVVDKAQGHMRHFAENSVLAGDSTLELRNTLDRLAELQQVAGQKTIPLTKLLEESPNALRQFVDNIDLTKDVGRTFDTVVKRLQELAGGSDGLGDKFAEMTGQSEQARGAIENLKTLLKKAGASLGILESVGDEDQLSSEQLIAARAQLIEQVQNLGRKENDLKVILEREIARRAARAGETNARAQTDLEQLAGTETDALLTALGATTIAANEMASSLDNVSDATDRAKTKTRELGEAIDQNAAAHREAAETSRRVAETQRRRLDTQPDEPAPFNPESNAAGVETLMRLLGRSGFLRSDLTKSRNKTELGGNVEQTLLNNFAKINVGTLAEKSGAAASMGEILKTVAQGSTTAAEKFDLFLTEVEQSGSAAQHLELLVGAARQLAKVLDPKTGLDNKQFKKLFEDLKGSAPLFAQLGTSLLAFEGLKGTGKGLEGVLAPFLSGLKGKERLIPASVRTDIMEAIATAIIDGLRDGARKGTPQAAALADNLGKEIKRILDSAQIDLTPSKIGLNAANIKRQLGTKLDKALDFRAAFDDAAAFENLTGTSQKGINRMINAATRSMAKMGSTVAASMLRGKGVLKEATDSFLEYTANALFHRSPPRVGPLSFAEPSFRLLGGTIGQFLLRGAGDLKQATDAFLGIGMGDIFMTAQQLSLLPLQATFKGVEKAGIGVEKTFRGIGNTLGVVVRFVPLLGRPLRGLSRWLGRFFGKLVSWPLRIVAAVGQGLVNLAQFLGNMVNKTIKAFRRMSEEVFRFSTDAKRAGADIQTFDILSRVGESVDVQATEISQAFIILRQNMAQAAREGSGPVVDAFNAIGLSINELRNTAPEDVFVRVAAGLQNATEGTEEYNQVLELLGASMTNLRALLTDPTAFEEGLRQARAQLIITDREVQAATEIRNTFKIIENNVRRLGIRLMTGFKPLITLLNELTLRALPHVDRISKGIVAGLQVGLVRLAFFIEDFLQKFVLTREARKRFVDSFKGAMNEIGDWLGKQLDKLLDKLPDIIAELASRFIPALLSAKFALLTGISQLTARVLTTAAQGTGLIDAEEQKRIQAGVQEKLSEVRSFVTDLLTGGESNKFFENLFATPAEGVNPLKESMAELAAITKTIIFGDIVDGIGAMVSSTESAQEQIDRLRKKLEAMKNETRDGFNAALATIRRASEIEEMVNAIVDRQSAQGSADSAARKRRQEALSALQTIQNKANATISTIENQIRGLGSPLDADALRDQLEDVFFVDLSKIIDDVAKNDPVGALLNADELNTKFKRIQAQLVDAFGVDVGPIVDIDFFRLTQSILADMQDIKRVQESIAGAQQTVQNLTSDWSTELLEVGATSDTIRAKFEEFVVKVKNANRAATAEVARQLGLQQATKDEIIARAEAMAKLAIEAEKAATRLKQIDQTMGVVKSLIDGAGALSGAFDNAAVMARKVPDQITVATANLRTMLAQKPELLQMFQEWANVTGDTEETIQKVAGHMERVLKVSNEIQAQRNLVEQFQRVDDILRRPVENSPFQALADQMGQARLESQRVKMELGLAAKETNALFELMAETAPKKLVKIAKQFQDSGLMAFDVELKKENAAAIAGEIAKATKASMEEAIRNVKIQPLVDTVRSSLGEPVVTTFTDTLRGLADGSIFEAARAAKEQAREAGIAFSQTLFVISELGSRLFERGLDALLQQFQERLTDALTQGITESILSSKVFGSIDEMTETMRRKIGAVSSGLLAAVGLVLSRLQSSADVVADGLDSVVQSSEAVRGVVSGDTTVSIKEQQENLKEALKGTEDRLDVLIELFKRRGGDPGDQGALGSPPFLGGVAASGL